ncbi:MAG TPA: phosphoribosylformylglycinamidine synthase subunit PurL, partial [Candidatus Cloacimonadota bacterium]|nr:phosphoribosylformylglycinamidine synthase subunit PurL [Candidatus Cloacimonadota bacterium]
ILRDIFTMDARPVAALNSLRFGNAQNPQVKHLISGVVSGIADYGNCFGVPTVGGEVYFEDSYEGNPLVNAMAVGLVKHGNIAKSAASGPGNLVVYVGAKTGRDGIHGATFASVDISEASEEKRTAVQVGDPFYEKLLLEATLEVIQAGLVVGIQDMGAAGLTCSSSEMSGKGGVGIDMDVALVPQREAGMNAYEIMLSESQERMLLIVKPDDIDKVNAIFLKWDLDAAIIGKVTDDGILRVRFHEEIVAEIPSEYLILGGKAPVYTREARRPVWLDELQAFDLRTIPEPSDYNKVLLELMGSPNIASKEAIYRQYDHMVQINTNQEPGSDAALVAIKDSKKALALTTDCNGRYCYLDPYEGAKAAVAEAARNIACSGAKPMAITNCLNFGNPHKPEIYWQLSEAVRGMGEACRAFETPVTGGNVSLYNENPTAAIYPTPVIGMLGLLDDYEKAVDQAFKQLGDKVLLLGENSGSLGASEYLKLRTGKALGLPPTIDLQQEKHLQELLLELADKRLLSSAHDCSEGGLAVCVAESCLSGGWGAELHFDLNTTKLETYFGEAGAKVVVSASTSSVEQIKELATAHHISVTLLGEVTQEQILKINSDISAEMGNLQEVYRNAIKA